MPSVITLTRVASLRVVGEADLVADEVAELDLHLLGDALRDRAGGDPAGLGVPDLAGRSTPAQLEAHLRQLGRLARARLARDDDDLVVADRREDVVAPLDDRQLRRVVQPCRVDGVAVRCQRADRLRRAWPTRIGRRRRRRAGMADRCSAARPDRFPP